MSTEHTVNVAGVWVSIDASCRHGHVVVQGHDPRCGPWSLEELVPIDPVHPSARATCARLADMSRGRIDADTLLEVVRQAWTLQLFARLGDAEARVAELERRLRDAVSEALPEMAW